MPPSSSDPGLNVIALISGGKDSLYSLLHCIRNGHRIVALANLYPEAKKNPDSQHASETKEEATTKEQEEETEDIDSFMYQTIGHSVIPLYEPALGIPLYRAPITGDAVDTARIYRHDAADQAAETSSLQDQEEDETESLVPLLRRIKEAHPEANAVSAGAILSTYQRTRIENVAARLGLVPLAWLWMYPSLPPPTARQTDSMAVVEAGLLEDMAACGCEARIIKAASGGLDDGFLWGDVSGERPLRRRIVKAMRRFAAPEDLRGAVLGEGGEYETLALDGPGFLWKQRIDIVSRETRTAEGGVAFMSLKGARCVPKDVEQEGAFSPQDVRRPDLLDAPFASLALEDLSSLPLSSLSDSTTETSLTTAWSGYEPIHRQTGTAWTISNLIAPEAGTGAGEQMKGIADKIHQELKTSHVRSTDDIVFTTVLLRSMSDFASMNSVYVSLFKKPNPPARVTVACGDRLPANVKVMVSLVVDLGARDHRQGLHVQSRSYWAPANIGPYSQAMSVPGQGEGRLVYIAGQIPLDPASMELVAPEETESYYLRTVLALQHLWRIGEAMQVDWWTGAVAFLAGSEHADARAQVAWHLWEQMHARPADAEDTDEDEGPQLDIWDIKYGRRAEELAPPDSSWALPKFSILKANSATSVPPFLAVQVNELPRGSDIEWQGLGSRCRQAEVTTQNAGSTFMNESCNYSVIEIESESALDMAKTQCHTLVQATLYTTQNISAGSWPGQIVPCRSVWGRGGRRLAAGVVLHREKSLER
ncbi:hypothetical protein N7474_008182 [Penicillium riverlandense]|uniref:uncharacterized protein n=1 Tax=Penicillium riverlandense TaxID=1903569 RepID=UPI00254979FB|nr:uncharacterized protein N7474_008182 [Penicillium riverlandense]KAJ5811881.1 hypothetical protein N7474_008182 [Penicillium riverlandense]